jgi:two-component system, sensor histidine kinase PdtaS
MAVQRHPATPTPRKRRMLPAAGDVTPATPGPAILGLFSLRSLRGRMALLLGAALLPMGLLTLNAGLKSAALAEQAAQKEVAARIDAGMRARQSEILRLRTVTRTIAANAVFARGGQSQCNAVMETLRTEFRELSAVTVLDEKSRIICAGRVDHVGTVAAAQTLVDRALARNDVVIGYVHTPNLSGGPVIAAVAPISTSGPLRFVGLTRVAAPLLAPPAGGDAIYSLLVDGNGEVLQAQGLAPQSPEYASLVRTLATARWRDAPIRAGATWAKAGALSEDDLYLIEGWRAMPLDVAGVLGMLWAIFAPVLVWALAVAATWLAVELYIVRPLTAVEMLARAYARGEDTAPPDFFRNAPVEIASLRRTLAAMAKTARGREGRLAEALQEERALLREINHRVNNNLQLVASLLAIQARASTVEQQAVGLARAHDRIQLLSLAQNQIYGSGHVRDVRLDEMGGEIARALTAARSHGSSRILLDIDMEEARGSIDHAVPLAFLMGESVSQALDMLEDCDRATLCVSLRKRSDGAIVFAVASPDGGPRKAPASPARRIIDAFARQIGVDVFYDPLDPLSVRMVMPAPRLSAEVDAA